MIREKLIEKDATSGVAPRWRNHEVSRIEGLSDAVFGFAITLLVVSLEVPRTFGELMDTMRGFAAFAISFIMLLLVWHLQYTFFRRYPLQDTTTFVLNAALLFVVLFYVYPLKFVWTLVVNGLMGVEFGLHLPNGEFVPALIPAQAPTMMMVFSGGYIAVFLVFALLYGHAYRKRHALELNELEIFDTREKIQGSLLSVAVGLLSMFIAFFGGPRYSALAGLSYFVLGPLMGIHGTLSGKRRKRLQRSLDIETQK